MTPALAKELVEALEVVLASQRELRELRGLAWTGSRIPAERYPEHGRAIVADTLARAVLARAKAETGQQEFTVTDDGHGRAMVGGRRLAFGGCGLSIGHPVLNEGEPRRRLDVGTRVLVELREGTDFATLLEVLS